MAKILYRVEIGTLDNGKFYAAGLSDDNKRFKISSAKFATLLTQTSKMLKKHRIKTIRFPLAQEQNIIIVPNNLKAAMTLLNSPHN